MGQRSSFAVKKNKQTKRKWERFQNKFYEFLDPRYLIEYGIKSNHCASQKPEKRNGMKRRIFNFLIHTFRISVQLSANLKFFVLIDILEHPKINDHQENMKFN